MTTRCDRPPRGWVCYKLRGHDGPCPTWPAWWNVLAKWRRMKPLGGYAQGGRISPPGPGERVAGIVRPAMSFDSREDMERHIFGREAEALAAFSSGQILTQTGRGYPPRSAAEDPAAPILWVGKGEPPLTEGAARVDDTWFAP